VRRAARNAPWGALPQLPVLHAGTVRSERLFCAAGLGRRVAGAKRCWSRMLGMGGAC